MKTLLVIFAAIQLVFGKLSPCVDGKGPFPKSVNLFSCGNEEDCDFIRGRSLIGDFEFTARE